jgi:GNAT superfamily N-acetyltransferase
MAGDITKSSWSSEPLAKSHERKVFSCGNDVLDHYLRNQASQDARRDIAAPFVLVQDGGKQVLGYYTLSAFGIDLGELPEDTAHMLPRYPVVPATLLGRLAVDRSCRGQGLGEFLLVDALARALGQAGNIASFAVVVDAIDDAARRFYLHFDFLPFPASENRFFLPMALIARLFR